MIKILNAYAGIGGNRKLWNTLTEKLEITAIEIDRSIAKIYHNFFQQDHVYIKDAHNYIKENYNKYDFIWSSPPCLTHSRLNNFSYNKKIDYPNFKLYEEIIFLNKYFKGKFIVENVIPYYRFLIQPSLIIGRHAYWSNFNLNKYFFVKNNKIMKDASVSYFLKLYGFDNFKHKNKRQLLRNCVEPEVGLFLLLSSLEKDHQNAQLSFNYD